MATTPAPTPAKSKAPTPTPAKIFLRQVTAQKQMRKIKADQPATW
ncbi:MAG: hypothetical protein PX637_05885 [Microcystis sp. M53601_WE4]|nr:hypothetical protein [Microcystis sp. M53601_WE4]